VEGEQKVKQWLRHILYSGSWSPGEENDLHTNKNKRMNVLLSMLSEKIGVNTRTDDGRGSKMLNPKLFLRRLSRALPECS